jgi:hypothetical protein
VFHAVVWNASPIAVVAPLPSFKEDVVRPVMLFHGAGAVTLFCILTYTFWLGSTSVTLTVNVFEEDAFKGSVAVAVTV